MQVIDFYAPTLRSEGPHIGLPTCALMVDDFGLRWLITDFPVPEGLWRRALASGAHGIMWNGGQCYAEDVAKFPTSQGMLLAPPLIAAPASILTRPFVHLHAHSEYSSLDGYGRIEEMVDVVAADGQDTMALTDHGVCAGHLELQKVARKKGIKPIFGVEAYLVPEARDKSRETYQSYWHFILLAKNKVGLHNLWRASTLAHSPDRFYGRPRMDWEVLRQCSEGVIASSACLRGPLSHLIEDDDEQGAREMLGRMSAIFGDDLYLELHTNQLDRQKVVNRGLVSLGREMGIPLIVVGDSHYACSSDQEAHQVWIAAQTDKTLADESDLFAGHEEYHLHSAAEVADAIAYLGTDVADAAIAMTVEVASRCDASATGRNITPVYHRKHVAHSEHQGGELDYDVMESICERAWADRVPPEALIGGEAHSVYRARLAEELAEFRTKKFSGYMLIVWDYMNWCRENRILVGPGRGSAAGSLVCFLMGITQIDPIDGGLLFERFISPGRTQLPDVDSDFPASKRGAVTDYIVQRWGAEHAVRVGTVTRLRNKGTFKEVAKVFKGSEREVPFVAQAEVSEIITRAESGTAGMGLSWDDLWTQVGTDLAPYAEAYPDWFRFAAQLVGRLKSYGKHPAGIVIDPEESLIDLLPLRQGEDDHPITEFPMDQLDELGFVKFDILTVRTLDTIQETMDLIDSDARYTGRIPHPHTWRRQEYADPMVWEMLRRGETLGIFQIETGEGTRLVNQFRPESLADLCAILTLVRPGPKNSGLTASYLRRRDGVEHVSYIHPLLEAVLSDTYGCMVYQEDIMNTVKVIAGYTSAEADEVRSILGKKKVDKIAAEGTRFVSRSLGMGIDQAIADTIFEQMAEFAKYCVTGDTEVWLAGSGRNGGGKVSVDDLYRRVNPQLLPAVVGRTKGGEEYVGPCVTCGSATSSGPWVRGQCQPCSQWLRKFRSVDRGVHGLTVEADERIRPCRVLNVHQTGVQPVWTVTLAGGRSITASAGHRHLSRDGRLVRVDELNIGDVLAVDAGYEKHVYERYEWDLGEGGFGALQAWTATAPDSCEECGHDGSEHRLERAHLDGDRRNNAPSNLRMLCVGCHKRHDYRSNERPGRWSKGHPLAFEEIVSIDHAGEQMTYSVVMDDPHIWIANGIATSNSFNKSHSLAYAVLAFWCAWYKVHFPIHFLVACLSTADKDRFPEFVADARRRGYRIDLPDVNESKVTFSVSSDGMGIRYGLSSVKSLGTKAAADVMANAPYSSWADFVERRGKACNWGHIKVLVSVGALDALIPAGHNRLDLEAVCNQMADGKIEQCRWLREGYQPSMGVHSCCAFNWEGEERPLGKSGKPLKGKPTPKACTKACRQYDAVTAISWPHNPDPTPVQVRRAERESFGLYVTSTPFDALNLDGLPALSEMSVEGNYQVVGEIQSVRRRPDSLNRIMAFMTVAIPDGSIDVVCFSKKFAQLEEVLRPDAFGVFSVERNKRGFSLNQYVPMKQE